MAARELEIVDGSLRDALIELLLRLADDELVLGHRDSEWTGFAPLAEEDVAFASIAQDEIGHAALYYDLLAALTGRSADSWAYERAAGEYRNAVVLERDNSGLTVGGGALPADGLPRRDWAFTVARQYLYDLADGLRLERLQESSYAPLRAAASRIAREERYHLMHCEAWMRRLASATAESRRRVQEAVDRLWPEVLGLFEETPVDGVLAESGLFPGGTAAWRTRWLDRVRAELSALELRVPEAAPVTGAGGRSGVHTPDLDRMLDDLTAVRRLDPEAVW